MTEMAKGKALACKNDQGLDASITILRIINTQAWHLFPAAFRDFPRPESISPADAIPWYFVALQRQVSCNALGHTRSALTSDFSHSIGRSLE